MSMYVFGYGSLMDVKSASRALKQNLTPGQLVPARVHGYRRKWSLKEQVFADVIGREVTAVFLNLDGMEAAISNGVLIRISDEELACFSIREKNYDPVDITERVELDAVRLHSGERVYTFVAKADFETRKGEAGLFVMERYLSIIHEACLRFGTSFAREYSASTEPVTYPILRGKYVFVNPEQAKLV